jgi:hypothetical protein
VGGITKGKIKVYVHPLNAKIGEETFKARIAFAQTENIPPLLGRTDIFDHFKVCYDNKQKQTTFIPIKPKETIKPNKDPLWEALQKPPDWDVKTNSSPLEEEPL